MDNKTIIMDYLQLTSHEYDEKIFQTYWNWCRHNGQTPYKTQMILSNASICKWWIVEFDKLLLQFIKTAHLLPRKIDLLNHHFYSLTIQIYELYPKPLINNVLRNLNDEQYKLQKFDHYAN